ncbi:hypothetical protein BDD43_0593 [Mucilaginibacter gracilis]|uniref:DUF5007 domain-containing protein n=2 Tax=Mucilaginibacter TaxID=423349 RepID=H1YIH2_9SPHI|nr:MULTISPECIES: hypothetical protein [Mucilaginibacter]EHQ26538.1 hypothetical protein Mucpa_2415 [Mucilaginibacter paludis DSM 18603]RKR80477.1 hypothetical protein BDD43_0593 [Mucilaginibacter gracilis]
MHKNTTYLIAAAVVSTMAILSCNKIKTGFISDNIYYNVNPFTVAQGNTAVSAGLVIDGSTTPLNVKLLSVRNMADNQDASKYLLTKDTIRIYKGTVTADDSTLALLGAKLKDSTLAPFSVNSIGGRLQFTQASKFVPIGSYNIDLQVSNIRGTRILNNACKINVVGSIPDTITYKAYNHSDATYTNFTGFAASLLNIKVTYIPGGPDKIIYVWKDKNGKSWNPANGEVIGRPGRPNFADFDPYFPVAKTDTSLEYRYPGGVPIFPLFTASKNYPGYIGGPYYYSIVGKHTDVGMAVNTTLTVGFFLTKGTFVVTTTVTDVARVP